MKAMLLTRLFGRLCGNSSKMRLQPI
jgi:hypothetical protein